MKKLSVNMRKRELLPGWIYFILQLTVIPVALVFINEVLGNPLGEAALNFIFFAVNFACAIFIFWRFLLENGKVTVKNPLAWVKGVGIGFGLYWFLSILVGVLILYLYPDFSNVNDDSIASLVEENTQLITFATVWLVPITEELFYRGLIFRGLYNRSRVAGFVVSVLVFSAVHVVGYIGLYEPMHLLLCFLQYLPASLCLALSYALSDSIWAPITMHILINYIGILAMR